MATPNGTTRQEIREALAPIIGVPVEQIGDDVNLVRLGLKSLHLMQLINGWRRSGIAVKFGDLAATPTVDAWALHLADRVAAAAEPR
ncbi:phosphopantetheine-binding protein [Streptomyces sp. NPDC059917]|uniref:phosphopantetheine-binding protein n=1 Tax=Streptomyces sp. NPDC059917 TaxID=3347002 RepID=UPI003652D564